MPVSINDRLTAKAHRDTVSAPIRGTAAKSRLPRLATLRHFVRRPHVAIGRTSVIRLLSVGVETYQDSSQHTVAFAENDASAITQAWVDIYGPECEAVTVLSAAATRGRILNELRTLAARTAPQDTLVFYFAGHGFSTGTHNLLSLNDTFISSLEDTAIRFDTVYGTLRGAGAQKLMLFIDACHSGFELKDSRGVVDMFSADELRMVDRDSDVAVSFASCNHGEESFPYPAERHGCWTYHLLRALRGEEPALLFDGEIIKAIPLQEHLASEVPALVRNIRTGTARQSPRFFGTLNQDFIVADLARLLASRAAVDDHLVAVADHVSLVGLEVGSVRQLSGFKKTHRVPDQINSATKGFVIDVGEDDIKQLRDELYDALHGTLGIKYSAMKVQDSKDGFRIISPGFDVQADLGQSPDDPGKYEIRISVDDFREPAVLRTGEFAEVFDGHIDQIEVSFNRKEDLDQIVKRLESSKFAQAFTYRRGQEITLEIEELSLRVHITPTSLTLSVTKGSLADLLELASQGLSAIAAGSVIGSLPAPASV